MRALKSVSLSCVMDQLESKVKLTDKGLSGEFKEEVIKEIGADELSSLCLPVDYISNKPVT